MRLGSPWTRCGRRRRRWWRSDSCCSTARVRGFTEASRERESPGSRLIAGSGARRNLDAVRTLLNIIWFVFSGFWLWLAYMLAGIICCVLIVTIPWGIASFRMANYAAWPFGRELIDKPNAGHLSLLGNVIWVIVAGWWLALTHIATGIALCLTIIGIPLAIANFKLIQVSLMPLGKQIVRKQPRQGRWRRELPAHLLKCRNCLIKIIAGVRGRHLGSDSGLASRYDGE